MPYHFAGSRSTTTQAVVYPHLLYLDNYSWTPPVGVSPQDMAVALLAPTAWIPRPLFCVLFTQYGFSQSTFLDFIFDICLSS